MGGATPVVQIGWMRDSRGTYRSGKVRNEMRLRELMAHFVPRAVVSDGVMTVRLMGGPIARSASFESVVDVDDFGQIVGVEFWTSSRRSLPL
jgi:hypothetical protein